MLASPFLLVTLASVLLFGGGLAQPIATQLGEAGDAPTVEATIGETPTVSTNASVLHIVTTDGSRLTNLAVNGLAPTWSPDGARIAFASAPGLAVIDADGSNLTVLSVYRLNVLEPDWSLDGSQIAFSGWEWDGPNTDIYIMHPDGSDLTRVTETEGSDETLAWSPDGRRIAFTLTSRSDE